ncbi:hypothetical protein [Kitasatospora sp. NPDC005856]|uniref:hypothetical protein n=1 Tax=Kitasatospora sp. NPDC005856 TaxID=3154566 RepID=UPI0033D348AC
MSMPYPGEPFAEAVGEAAQTSAVAVRLVLAVADAVRRAAQRRAGGEQALPAADQAVSEASGDVKALVAPAVARALMSDADWPVMARQLVALRRAGVDLEDFLPRVGDLAASVGNAVEANAARIAAEGTQEWARLLRSTLPASAVREAILSSPTWPEIAATMQALRQRGVDVRRILTAAHAEGVGVDQAVDRVLRAGRRSAASPGPDPVRSYGPLTAGLDVPNDLALGSRFRALAQLGVSQSESARFVRWVHEALPKREREAALLVNSRQWPLLAARMARMQDEGRSVPDHLTRLMRDRSWESGPTSSLAARLVRAAADALNRPTPEDCAAATVLVGSAKARSATTARPPRPTRTTRTTRGVTPTRHPAAPYRAPLPNPLAGRSR